MNKRLGQLGLICVAMIWGTGFVASALSLDYFSPYQILALRFGIAFVVLLFIFRKKLKEISKKTLFRGSFLGLILYLAFAFQTVGLQYTSPSKNAFLTAVNVVIVPFLGFLILKRRVPIKGIIGAFVTFFGIGFLSLDNSLGGFNLGDGLTLVCALFFALQIFFTDFFVEEEEAWQLTLIQMGSAACYGLIALLFSKNPTVEWSIKGVAPVLYLGLISTLLAFFLQTVSQKHTSSTETAIILSTESFFGMLSSVIILGEQITSKMIIGAILIFAGILIVELNPKELFKQKSEEVHNEKEKKPDY